MPGNSLSRGFYATFKLLLISLVLIGFSCHGDTVKAKNVSQKKHYVIGVFPHLPPRDLYSVFSPIAADLGKVANRRMVLRTSTTFLRFMQLLDTQEFDVAFVQPFDYVRMADKYGYEPLATRSQLLTAILVVTPGSKFKTVKDLKDKTIALPPEVAAVSHLTKALLKENNLEPGKDVKIVHYRSHVSCMQQVLIGVVHACGTAAPAYRFFQHKMNTKLKIVGKSKAIPHTLFAVHPRVPEVVRKKLRDRIVSWSKTAEGKKLLSRGRLQPFIPVKDKDYDVVRRMRKQ